MKILQLTLRYPPALGGVEEHVYQLTKGLTNRNHKVKIFTSDLKSPRPFVRLKDTNYKKNKNDKIDVQRFTAIKLADLKYGLGIITPGMINEILSEKADIVHAHSFGFWPTYIGLIKKICHKTPFVVTPHSNPGSRDYSIADLRKLPLKKADKIIALTNLENEHLNKIGISKDKIIIIPNGVDLDKFKKPTNSSKEYIVLYVGRIDIEHKGLDILIKSIPTVIKYFNEVKFALIGPDWGDLHTLKRLAVKYKVEDHIVFTGQVSENEKIQWYNKATIYIQPSNIEPFGLSILEAMACGKPVIATQVGGIPSIIKDGENGLTVPPQNPKKLAESIVFLLQNRKNRNLLGKRGKISIQKYSWITMTKKIEKIYNELIK